MRRRIILLGVALAEGLAAILVLAPFGYAVWAWSPGTKNWVTPGQVDKEGVEERFARAQELFEGGGHKRAIAEYRKLIRNYPDSLYASRSQYAIGAGYEALGKYSRAAREYQKVIDNYPASDKVAEVVESQYRLGNFLFRKEIKSKFKKAFLENNYEEAAGVYQLVIRNAPYGERAAEVQYRIGLSYFKRNNYAEAISAYRKVIESYPQSPWVEKAYYEIGSSYLSQSLSPYYDQAMTDSALKQFQEFEKRFPDSELIGKVKEKIKLLKSRKAETRYQIALFYEKQGSVKAAGIYYQEVVERYPESSWAGLSRERLSELKEVN